jgi:BTB/POZ domain
MADPRSADACDVKFLIGPEKREFLANKRGLAYHSPVFHRMFFTDFPSENEIVVPDVNADAFKVMLNGISGQEVLIEEENVAAVYYVAEKYDLQLLRQMCKTYVLSYAYRNALVMLNSFHHYNLPEINEECLRIILKEPLEFFEKPEFLEAPADVIRTIFKTRSINCSFGDLKTALSAWMTKNGLNYTDSEWFEDVEEHLQITQEELESKALQRGLFRKFDYNFTDKCVLQTSENLESVEDPVFLYGFGLVIGKVRKESIRIEISTDRDCHVFEKTVAKDNWEQNRVSIQDVFIDKTVIYGFKLEMKITFNGKGTQRACVQYNKQDSFVSHFILSKYDG